MQKGKGFEKLFSMEQLRDRSLLLGEGLRLCPWESENQDHYAVNEKKRKILIQARGRSRSRSHRSREHVRGFITVTKPLKGPTSSTGRIHILMNSASGSMPEKRDRKTKT
jgi:hypothetical protein